MMNERHKTLASSALVAAFLAYTFSIYHSLPVKEPQTTTAAQNGKLIWQKMNCGSCHQLYGLGGYLGPDLTNAFSKRGEATIKAFIQSGTAVMPRFPLSETEIDELTAFLKEVDASGNADPKSFQIRYDGFIQQ